MLDNLDRIRGVGVEEFLASERQRWTCAECGGVICVHRENCLLLRPPQRAHPRLTCGIYSSVSVRLAPMGVGESATELPPNSPERREKVPGSVRGVSKNDAHLQGFLLAKWRDPELYGLPTFPSF